MPYCQACRVIYTDPEMRNMNVKMHTFPRKDWQQNFLISWLSFCGMPLHSTDLKNKFVCSKHFAVDDYFPGANRRLRKDAVPHLCPPSELVTDGDPRRNIATKPPKNKNLYDLGRREMLENVKRQLCRLCGKREGSLKPIFEEQSDDTQMSQLDLTLTTKIKMYLPVKIDFDESLPLNICTKCSDLLDQFHEMNVTCLAVDSLLRKTFNVDETDALFESADERMQDAVMESERCRQQLQESITRIMREHETILGSMNKSLPTFEKQNPNFGATANKEIKRKQFVCSYCGEGFFLFKLRNSHIVTCRNLPGLCEICGKEFARKDLKNHVKKHSATKQYMCDKCAECFHTIKSLEYHTQTKHELNNSIKYCCELCCKAFYDKFSYERHLKCHKEGNKGLMFDIDTNGLDECYLIFKCPVCEETFDDKISLIVHLNAPKNVQCGICLTHFQCEKGYFVHQACDKWMCHHCQKMFCHLHALVAHERVHTGEKPYKCMRCGIRFRTLFLKSKHQAIHHPPEHQCPYCNKTFMRKDMYDEHVNVHTGQVITCPMCYKTFGGKLSLQRHNRLFHNSSSNNENPFSNVMTDSMPLLD